MTTMAQGGGDPARDRAWLTRRRILVVVGLLMVVVVGGTAATAAHLDGQYGPLQGGSYWGPHPLRGFTSYKNGYSYRLANKPGATANLIAGLDNNGAHSVKVTSINHDTTVSNIRWSVYRFVNGGYISGEPSRWYAFPALIPAHGSIRLLITLHRPAYCDRRHDRANGLAYSGSQVVHWQSLLRTHRTPVELIGGVDRQIRIC